MCHKYLGEPLLLQQVEEVTEPYRVQLFKDIVQEQYGLYVRLAEQLYLGELQADQEAFFLSLRGMCLAMAVIDKKAPVVKVRSPERSFSFCFPLPAVPVGCCRVCRIGFISYPGRFLRIAADLPVEMADPFREPAGEVHALFYKEGTMGCQLCVIDIQQVMIRGAAVLHFQVGVLLLQHLIVVQQVLQVACFFEAKDAVKEFAPVFPAARDDVAVIGRDHHGGVFPDMFADLFIRDLTGGEGLFAVLPYAGHFLRRLAVHEDAADTKAVLVVLHIIFIPALEIAFGEAQVINGIQQVGLADAVKPRNAHYFLPEGKAGMGEIPELGQCYGF